MTKKEYDEVVLEIENKLRSKKIAISFEIKYEINLLLQGIQKIDGNIQDRVVEAIIYNHLKEVSEVSNEKI